MIISFVRTASYKCILQDGSRMLRATSEIAGNLVPIPSQNLFNVFFFFLKLKSTIQAAIKTIKVSYILQSEDRLIYHLRY